MAWERQPGNIQKSLTTKLLCLEEDLQQDARNECSTAGIWTAPAQLHVFISDLEDMAERTLKFADDKFGESSWYAQGQGCCSEGPRQAAREG